MSRTRSLAAEARTPDSPVATFMRQHFPHLREVQAEFRQQVANLPTIRPQESAGQPPYSTIGAAVDYRLRYYFRKTIIQTMDAFRGAQYLRGPLGSGLHETVLVPMYGPAVAAQINTKVSMPRLAAAFFDSLERLVAEVNPTRRILSATDELRLSRHCYILALFEQAMRTFSRGTGPGGFQSPLYALPASATVEDLLASTAEEWIKDIGRMAWLFGKRHSQLFYTKVKVNPAHLSSIGGFGADADLLVDGYVIDIKAALHPALEASWLYQVLGYTLLDQGDSKGIQGVGFYLARQGVFVQWPLEPLLRRLSGSNSVDLPKLRSDFHNAL